MKLQLKDKTKMALDECRILLLGAQFILGFQYRAVLEPGFDRLSPLSQQLNIGALGLMLLAVGLLLAPAAYHRIVEEGENSNQFHRFITLVATLSLLPFVIGLGALFFVVSERLLGRPAAAAMALAAGMTALVFWFGLGVSRWLAHPSNDAMQDEDSKDSQNIELKDKIDQALTEVRVVLPGAQALLGFQFVAMLTDSFERLPRDLQLLHLACLALVALSTVLLITPAAYHRIAETGEVSERFHQLTGRLLLTALVPLALGLTGDFYVVVLKVVRSSAFALAAAAAMLFFFFALWFGFSFWCRHITTRPS